jgi:hypothetical protein
MDDSARRHSVEVLSLLMPFSKFSIRILVLLDDTDIESKSTYTLLAQLFSLQWASGSMQAPLLTIRAR